MSGAAKLTTSLIGTSVPASSSVCLRHLSGNCAIVQQTACDLPPTPPLTEDTNSEMELPSEFEVMGAEVPNHVSPANSIGTVSLCICRWQHIPGLHHLAAGADSSDWLATVSGPGVLGH